MSEWEEITPRVINSAEFLEIASDFGDPMELFRESLHNAFDWESTQFQILINEENIDGQDKIVIELIDNGTGMNKETLMNNFWNLGDSRSRDNTNTIGEKGHGTKIYLRSDRIIVHTSDGEHSYESICENAYKDLNAGKVHKPTIRESEERYPRGTFIRIEGYNFNQSARLSQKIIKDYLYWFSILGTVETQFDGRAIRDFKVFLKALDVDTPEELKMGHPFADENCDVPELLKEYGENAADYFVKKYTYTNQSLRNKPQVKFDAVIYFEGDEAKRKYNDMIRKKKSRETGSYKVSDRYGIWLCKDYVPIQRVNDWIPSFGLGSNSFGLLHGFINCQKLKLTANRGTISNTNLEVIDELREAIQGIIEEINDDLYDKDILSIMTWKEQTHVLNAEKANFTKRKHIVEKKQFFKIDDKLFLVPRNETELYGLFIALYTLYPEDFDFEPLDYDATVGVDLLARNKSENPIADCEFWYVELKYQLGAKKFNHSFSNIRRIVCWELAPNVKDGTILSTSIEDTTRTLRIKPALEGQPRTFYLDSDDVDTKIRVICLREYIEKKLGLTLLNQ